MATFKKAGPAVIVLFQTFIWHLLWGFLQLVLGALQTQRQQVITQDLLGYGEHFFNVGVFQKSSAHAHKLAALTGEEEHGAAAAFGSPLRRRCWLAVRGKSGGFSRRRVISSRGTGLVGGQRPAQRDQRPDLPSGRCRHPDCH